MADGPAELTGKPSPMRVLLVNRMAALERGGGETFDLEMAAQLAKMGCEVTLLCGWPWFRGLRSEVGSPRSEVGSQKSAVGGLNSEVGGLRSEVGGRNSEVGGLGSEVRSLRSEVGSLGSDVRRPTSALRSLTSVVHLRSPYLPWFPWDKVKGGWRVRVWEFQQFEKKAARWIYQHADEFDIIQICELPYLVSLLKKDPRPETRDPRPRPRP